MLHFFNSNEGNGQSHTYCGTSQSVEVYHKLLNAHTVKVCPECDRLATAADEFITLYDL